MGKVNLAMQNQFVEFAKKDGEGNDIGESIKALQDAISGVVAFDGEVEVEYVQGQPTVTLPQPGIYKCKGISGYGICTGTFSTFVKFFMLTTDGSMLKTGGTSSPGTQNTLSYIVYEHFNGTVPVQTAATHHYIATSDIPTTSGIYKLTVGSNYQGFISIVVGSTFCNGFGVYKNSLFLLSNTSIFSNLVFDDNLLPMGTKLYKHTITPINVSYGGVQYQLTGSVINTNANEASDLSELFNNTTVVSQAISFRNSSYVYFRCNGYTIGDGSFIGVDDSNQVHSFFLSSEWLYDGISITDTVTPL